MPPTTADDVHALLDLMAGTGAVPVVAGIRGIDALIGRHHPDTPGFTTGAIAGREVRCITPDLQTRLHRGYGLQPRDPADMDAPVGATGISWKAP